MCFPVYTIHIFASSPHGSYVAIGLKMGAVFASLNLKSNMLLGGGGNVCSDCAAVLLIKGADIDFGLNTTFSSLTLEISNGNIPFRVGGMGDDEDDEDGSDDDDDDDEDGSDDDDDDDEDGSDDDDVSGIGGGSDEGGGGGGVSGIGGGGGGDDGFGGIGDGGEGGGTEEDTEEDTVEDEGEDTVEDTFEDTVEDEGGDTVGDTEEDTVDERNALGCGTCFRNLSSSPFNVCKSFLAFVTVFNPLASTMRW